MPGAFDYREVDTSLDPTSAGKYGVQVVPTMVVLDGSGNTVDTITGVPLKSRLRDSLEKAATQ